jgi:hypothetical protein
MSTKIRLLAIMPLAVLPAVVSARGVTPYLPLNLDPEVESQVERVLILGDKPLLTRPIPAALVVEALPKACEIDPVLCAHVQKYLMRYMGNTNLEFLSIEASAGTGANPLIPNAHGQTMQDRFQVSGAGYLQMGDYALLNLGVVAYEGRAPIPTGTYLSLGFDFAQLDIGWRDHWWSPMRDDSMLISTEAPTMPSVTISNYRPLTRLGIKYELFAARMSYSTQIETAPDGVLTQGYPRMSGLHLSIEPVSGWSVGANRVLIYGGGAAAVPVGTVLNSFFNPAKAQSSGVGTGSAVVGKQEASVGSQFIFPGAIPFTFYAEYAGNDTSQGKNYYFGKPDLSFGLHIPVIGPFDLTIESQTWAPTWYVHGFSAVQTGYGDGITNDHVTIGNWFGDQRRFGDAVGGQSLMVRLGFEPSFGGLFDIEGRMLRNDSIYPAVAYYREYTGTLRYSYPWRGYAIGGQLDVGRDVFGDHFARLAAFMRLGEALRDGSDSGSFSAQRSPGAELFVDIGANANKVRQNILPTEPEYTTGIDYGPHLGLGARRQVSTHQDLGVRLEADEVQGRLMLSIRALDYRYRFNDPLAINLFVGATRYDLGTPAMGWYLGGGLSWRDILPGWDLGVDYRYGVAVDRLRVLPSDPFPLGDGRPDEFHDIYGVAMYLSRKF